jgi:phospholipase D1/2
VYVHDKMLIADDAVAIIGSANINDRSMLGDRDSEIAVVVTDCEKRPITLAGQNWEASRFVHDLRTRLWRKHLGDERGVRGSWAGSVFSVLVG